MRYATKPSAVQPVASLFAAILFAGLLLVSLMGAGAGRAWADTPHVTQHTKAEIVDHLANSGTFARYPTTYAVQPELYNQMGELSDDTKQAALAMLNNIRYIAGLNPVTLDDEYGQLAQAAAFGDYSIGLLTHYLDKEGAKPDEMSDELWQLCLQGARSTNISSGQNVVGAVMGGWMADEDSDNIDRVGHRRWCLNPTMGATGFGQASAYAAMYSFDGSGSGSQTNVVWPAQVMPAEYFDASYPWTISTGSRIADPSSVRVTITKVDDESVQWTFDELSASAPSNTRSKYFNINNTNFGQIGCIIFRPDNFTFAAGDVFHVQASGVNGGTIEYDVEFIAGYPVESISFGEQTQYVDSYFGTLYLNGVKTVQPDAASGYKIEWSSSDESVATVDSSGRVQKVAPGKTVVTATIPGRYTKSGNPVSASVDVVVPKSIYNDTSISVDSASLEYTGETVVPKVTVTDNDTGAILVEGEDYYVSISGDAVEPNSEGIVWVYGKNNYAENRGLYYYVAKRTVAEDMVSLVSDTLVYNGEVQHPQLSVAYGARALEEGTDYTVRYTGGTNAGTYQATITGRGTYFRGSCAKEFRIEPKPLEASMLTASPTSFAYNEQRQEPTIALAFNGRQLVQGTDYDVQISGNPVGVGSYTYAVQGRGDFSGTLTGEYEIEAASVAVSNGEQVQADGSLTYGQPLADLNVLNSEFVSETTGQVVEGTFAFNTPDAMLDVGTHEVAWTFTPQDANYNALTGALQVTVEKAVPTVLTQPTAAQVVYHPTRTLADCAIDQGEMSVPGTWGWNAPDTALPVPGGTFSCVFTPVDSKNYEQVSAEVSVVVDKCAPYVVARAGDITYGQSLSNATLSGTAQWSLTDATAVAGEFNWKDGSISPVCADSGATLYEAVFTPQDPLNYESATAQISLQVNQAERPATWPSEQVSVGNSVVALANNILPDNWEFDQVDVGTELQVEVPVAFTARYVAPDAANYKNVEAQVTVTRSSCDHLRVELRDTRDATCVADGYSGDTYCLDCGEKVSSGQVVAALGHAWDEGVVTTEPTCKATGIRTFTCSRCGDTRTAIVDIVPHSWEWQTVTPATCTAPGLEHEVCSQCGEEGGSREIAQLEHAFKWVTETSATCTAAGLEHEVCSLCGQVGAEREIAQLEHAFKWVTETSPTCVDEGLEKEVCSYCGFVGPTRSIPKTNEHMFGDWHDISFATCTEDGLQVRMCTLCAAEQERTVVAFGHAWGSWETVKRATTSAEGQEKRVCSTCGKAETRAIPKLEQEATKLPTKISGDVSPRNPVAAKTVNKQITSMKTDADPKGSTFELLRAKGVAASKTSVKLTWKKVAGATSYVVYGNRCGKYKCTKVKTVKGTSFTHKKLKKGTYYKYVVVALKGDAALATSKTIHVATKGGKVGNPKSVTVKLKKAKATLQKGKKLKLGAKVVPQSKKLKVKKHRALKYYSTNKKIATVNSKGLVTAKSPGTCTIYAFAQNGVYKAVKITVKASLQQAQALSGDTVTQQSSNQLQRAQASQAL